MLAFDFDVGFRFWLYRFTPPALSCGGVKTGVFSPVLVGGTFDFSLWIFALDFRFCLYLVNFHPNNRNME